MTLLQDQLEHRVVFTEAHLEYFQKAFPDTPINPEDPGLVHKLLIREGQKQVINNIKDHVIVHRRTHVL